MPYDAANGASLVLVTGREREESLLTHLYNKQGGPCFFVPRVFANGANACARLEQAQLSDTTSAASAFHASTEIPAKEPTLLIRTYISRQTHTEMAFQAVLRTCTIV